MDARSPKIGILDSGVGGLSVLKEIHDLLPHAELYYVGDSAWCPYGNKSPQVILGRVTTITDYLLNKGVDIIVIACNSATIHAVGALRASYPIPIVGMEPAVKPAAALTKSGVIGVLATEASIAGEKFHHLVNQHANGVTVITRPCPRFVELVEKGILSGPEADAAVKAAITPLTEAGADVFVLGCTHYPFLRSVVEEHVPPGSQVVDTGPAVAKRVVSLLPAASDSSKNPPEIHIETTGEIDQLNSLLPKLLPGIKALTSAAKLP